MRVSIGEWVSEKPIGKKLTAQSPVGMSWAKAAPAKAAARTAKDFILTVGRWRGGGML